MNVYWIGDGPKGTSGNFGDILTPIILDYFNIPYNYVKSYNKDFDAICVGSIAKFAKEGTLVLGSGFASRKNGVCPSAEYRLVRGPLTRDMVIKSGGVCPELYGDPALLLPLIYAGSCEKEYEIGIIPHATHYNTVKEQYPDQFVINLNTSNPKNVIEQITKCKKIISGSLHGIIVANAYDIPAAWVDLGPIKGDGMKFFDYFLSVGITNAGKSIMTNPNFFIPKKDLTEDISSVFLGLKNTFKGL